MKTDKRIFILSILLVISSFLLISQILAKATNKQSDDVVEYYDLFNEVMLKVQNEYVDEVTPKQLMEGAINGMIFALNDPHSQFLGPDNFNQLEQDIEGEFSGIGIHIGVRDGILTVIAPIPGSPSAKLGIQSWDRIVEIDGQSSEGMSIDEAVRKLKGPEGTKVKITIYRKDTPDFLKFEITRAKIKVKSVYSTVIDNNIGYIRLAKFSHDTTDSIKQALKDLKSKEIQAIIIDLRWNWGGALKEAIDTCDLFLNKGQIIVSTEGRLKESKYTYTAKGGKFTDVPMAVLINHGSASASEIFTGAMKDLKRGIIIGPKGQKTWGKGSVQTIEPLVNTIEKDEKGNPKPSALRITTAYYMTPSGQKIHNIGITPDIEVDLPKDHELELQKHGLLGEPNLVESEENKVKPEEIPTLNNKKEETPSKPEEKSKKEELKKPEKKEVIEEKTPEKIEEKKDKEKPEEFVDIQLQEAVKILKAHMILEKKPS